MGEGQGAPSQSRVSSFGSSSDPYRPAEGSQLTGIDASLARAMLIDGALTASLVDATSGFPLGKSGNGAFDLDVAAAGTTEIVRATIDTVTELGLRGGVEDLVITLDTQYHLIRMVHSRMGEQIFLHVSLDRERCNLAMARRELQMIERDLAL